MAIKPKNITYKSCSARSNFNRIGGESFKVLGLRCEFYKIFEINDPLPTRETTLSIHFYYVISTEKKNNLLAYFKIKMYILILQLLLL